MKLAARDNMIFMVKLICTHNGNFHADDVFSVALLLDLYPEAKVIRSRKPADFKQSDLVVDVGLEYDPEQLKFDHHQREGAGQRANGIKYSGFGLIWKHFGLRYVNNSQEVWQRIDSTLVNSIDAGDNSQAIFETNHYQSQPFTIYDTISVFVPSFNEDLNKDEQFAKAVGLAQQILRRLVIKTKASVEAGRLLLNEYSKSPDPRYVLLDKYIPLTDVVDQLDELLYVVYPAEIGGWQIRAVNKKSEQFVSRKPLPKQWRGLPKEDLANITGIDDINFCHSNGFIGGAETKAGILQMLQLALSQPNPAG